MNAGYFTPTSYTSPLNDPQSLYCSHHVNANVHRQSHDKVVITVRSVGQADADLIFGDRGQAWLIAFTPRRGSAGNHKLDVVVIHLAVGNDCGAPLPQRCGVQVGARQRLAALPLCIQVIKFRGMIESASADKLAPVLMQTHRLRFEQMKSKAMDWWSVVHSTCEMQQCLTKSHMAVKQASAGRACEIIAEHQELVQRLTSFCC